VKAVEVWYLRTEEVAGGALLQACDKVLSEDERERMRAFFFEKDRHEYLVTRALSRGVLAQALGVAPSSLAFRRNAYGRPELDPPNDLRFNLTNTTGLVACAIASRREVGVDAEPVERADDILEVAHVVFTEAERDTLARLEISARRILALRLWTAKEAYIKARGLGLSLSPAKLHLGIRDSAIVLTFLEDIGDDPTRWHIVTQKVEGHMVGLCAERLLTESDESVLRHANIADLLGLTRPAHGASVAGTLTRISPMEPSRR
jgi:4'-phosphopantetheinyl transferase